MTCNTTSLCVLFMFSFSLAHFFALKRTHLGYFMIVLLFFSSTYSNGSVPVQHLGSLIRNFLSSCVHFLLLHSKPFIILLQNIWIIRQVSLRKCRLQSTPPGKLSKRSQHRKFTDNVKLLEWQFTKSYVFFNFLTNLLLLWQRKEWKLYKRIKIKIKK